MHLPGAGGQVLHGLVCQAKKLNHDWEVGRKAARAERKASGTDQRAQGSILPVLSPDPGAGALFSPQ